MVLFAYDPAGTAGAARTSFTPGFAKSAMDCMFAGLPGAMIISKLFVVKFSYLLFSKPGSFVKSCLVHFWSAAMKTSAGAPVVIWVYRVLEESELSIIFTLLSFSNCAVISSVT